MRSLLAWIARLPLDGLRCSDTRADQGVGQTLEPPRAVQLLCLQRCSATEDRCGSSAHREEHQIKLAFDPDLLSITLRALPPATLTFRHTSRSV